jgi:hypothetical protein
MIDVCGICLDEDSKNTNVKLEPCNHIFHKHCITDLYKFNRLPTCPYCRSNIIDIIEQNTYNSLFLDILSDTNYFDLYDQHFQEIQQELYLNEMLLEYVDVPIEDEEVDVDVEYDVEDEYEDDFEIYYDEFEFNIEIDTDIEN